MSNSTDRSAYHKAWYEANRETIRAQQKVWRETNREAIAAQGKTYREANRETRGARAKAYREANPAQWRAAHRRRRALKANAEGSFTPAELEALYESYDYRCLCCGQREGDVSGRSGEPVQITADHVIPLALGGSNYIDNIQPLCRSCNCSKGAWHATDYRLPENMFMGADDAADCEGEAMTGTGLLW